MDARDKPGHDDNRQEGRRLGRDISLALVFKIAFLTVLYLAFFSGDERPRIDEAAAARHLLGPGEATR